MKNETFSGKASELITEQVREKIIGEVSQSLEQDPKVGLANYSRDILERINVETIFFRENDEDFKQNRESLQNESGLVISNHPSMADGPLLLQTIEREDLKIVVKPKLFEQSAGTPFQDKLIPAYSEGLQALKSIKEIIAHIKAGGLVLIFPTGGNEIDVQEFNFKDGFRVILDHIPGDCMVYCFNIDTNENKHLSSKNQFKSQTTSDFLSGFSMPVSAFNKKSIVQVGEKYTTVDDWKNSMVYKTKEQKNEALVSYYRQLFETA